MGPGRQAGKSILVVEDDVTTRHALTRILARQGYSVTGAANGREAIDRLRAVAPDLILLDLMMPVMDGWEFRREQRQDPTLAAIPVVVLSADGSAGQKAEVLEADGYLQKPVELDTLLDTVQRYC